MPNRMETRCRSLALNPPGPYVAARSSDGLRILVRQKANDLTIGGPVQIERIIVGSLVDRS